MIDILIFLMITVFFIFKLKNNFGNRSNDDENRKKSMEEFFKQKYSAEKTDVNKAEIIDITDKVKPIEKVKLVEKSPLSTEEFKISDELQQKLSKINFSQDSFLKGVETAVEMINEAFSSKDLETLKNLLSKKIFDNFNKQIDNLNSQNRTLISSLISVLSKKIESISIKDEKVFIEVFLETEQINFIENEKKEIVLGDKKKIDLVKEKWIFERSLNSKTNFWIIDNITNIE